MRLQRKTRGKALDLYNDLLTLREPPMRILFLLSKQFRQMTLAKKMAGEGAAQSEIASKLGCRRLWHGNLLTCARAYSTEELEQAEVDFCRSGGSSEDRQASGCAECGTADREVQQFRKVILNAF